MSLKTYLRSIFVLLSMGDGKPWVTRLRVIWLVLRKWVSRKNVFKSFIHQKKGAVPFFDSFWSHLVRGVKQVWVEEDGVSGAHLAEDELATALGPLHPLKVGTALNGISWDPLYELLTKSCLSGFINGTINRMYLIYAALIGVLSCFV